MDHRDSLPPIVPIEAALALSVVARRAVQQSRRYLLRSAPLTGLRPQRLARATGARSAFARLAWRNPAGPGARSAPRPTLVTTERHLTVTRSVVAVPPLNTPGQPAAQPAAGIRDVTPQTPSGQSRAGPSAAVVTSKTATGFSTTGQTGLSPGAVTRSAPPGEGHSKAPPAGPLHGPRPTSMPEEGARGFAVAPALVWFTRWRDVRLARTVHEQRTAGLVARDGVRRTAGVPLLSLAPAPADAIRPAMARSLSLPADSMSHFSQPTAVPAGIVSHAARNERTPARAAIAFSAWLAPLLRRTASVHAPNGAAADSGTLTPIPLVIARSPSAARVLEVVNHVIGRRVKSHTRQEVALALRSLEASRRTPATAPDATAGSAAPAETFRVDDRTANALMDRIQALSRQERFRHGLLR